MQIDIGKYIGSFEKLLHNTENTLSDISEYSKEMETTQREIYNRIDLYYKTAETETATNLIKNCLYRLIKDENYFKVLCETRYKEKRIQELKKEAYLIKDSFESYLDFIYNLIEIWGTYEPTLINQNKFRELIFKYIPENHPLHLRALTKHNAESLFSFKWKAKHFDLIKVLYNELTTDKGQNPYILKDKTNYINFKAAFSEKLIFQGGVNSCQIIWNHTNPKEIYFLLNELGKAGLIDLPEKWNHKQVEAIFKRPDGTNFRNLAHSADQVHKLSEIHRQRLFKFVYNLKH